jgi:BirA family biotin operon repressor/biotin-[acetyl-CoA-carboxylase] ligase
VHAPAPLGQPRVHLRVTDSTNARARELAARGAPHGTVVSAAEQTAGRGRQGRVWSAPAGRALLCSVIVRSPPRLLPLASGLAVAESCDRLAPDGARAQLKWPNDVLIDGRKVAGILVEGRPQDEWALVGIGLNVAVGLEQLPLELRERAGTLGLGPEAVEPALAELLQALARWLSLDAQPRIPDAFRARDALRDRRVAWGSSTGLAEGIDPDGRLLVRLDSGELTALDSGEVHLGT